MRDNVSVPTLTLDDAAALLVLLDPRDQPGLRKAHEALAKAAPGDERTRSVFEQAGARLRGAFDRPEEDVRVAVDEACRLLEDAMDASDREERGETDSGNAAAAPCSAACEDEVTVLVLPEDTDLDLLRDFAAESRDCLDAAEVALLALENDPRNADAINAVFRAFHTIKGTSAFLGLTHITTFAHHSESLLSAVRDGEIAFTASCADLALRSSDTLKALLETAQRATPGERLEAPASYDSLLAAIVRAATEPEAPVDAEARAGGGRAGSAVAAGSVAGPHGGGVGAETPATEGQGDASAPTTASTSADSSVRVRTDRLDRLIDMVGELVIAQAMIAQDKTVVQGARQDFARKVSHAGKIVRELQDLSMSMRMVPLRNSFQKMVRLTRDAAQRSGKQVEIHLVGEDTEIDRNMVDVIADPLVHMVRNAVDHGIESPEERVRAGKPAGGTLRLSAYHAGGNVVVELEDDGRGLNREKILQKALEKGLISSDKGMSDAMICDLIFEPGFSTNDVVTSLSGRGVGMDVVRRNIDTLKGRVDISSVKGHGTRFTIRLPLTLAITDGMLVRVGDERYIIPIIHIRISFRPGPGALSTIAGRGEMVLLRDDLMPIVRLHKLFGIPGAISDPGQGLLVVTGIGEHRCALLVDELLGQQQVVAKPLGDGLQRVPGIAGGAILGDGRVGLILDVPALVARAGQNHGDARMGFGAVSSAA